MLNDKMERKKLIAEGIITKNGTPKVCIHCGNTNFVKQNYIMDHLGIIVSMSLLCSDCRKTIAVWNNGVWGLTIK
jgi:hypothetical protein